MKRTIAVLLLLCLLCACQPTPETDAVKQKNTNQLIETVVGTEEQDPDTPEVPLGSTLPERVESSFVTDAQQVAVNIDARVYVLTDGASFPLARVERRAIGETDRLTLLSRVLGADKLYRFTEHPIGKQELAERIAEYMQEPTPEEKAAWLMEDVDNTEETWQAYLDERAAIAQALQEQYRSLPDGESVVLHPLWDGTVPADGSPVYIVPDAHAPYAGRDVPYAVCQAESIRWQGGTMPYDEVNKAGTVRIAPEDLDTPCGDAVITPRRAGEIAAGLFRGIADLQAEEILWGNDADTDGAAKGFVSQWAYAVRLTPRVGGAALLYESRDASDPKQEKQYLHSWDYAHAVVVVDGTGAVLCGEWIDPQTVTEILSETTPLLPFDEVLSVFRQQINRTYAAEEYRNGTLTIDRITLGLFRVREQNSMETGLLVPAWQFSGRIVCDTYPNMSYQDDQLLINAVDGTIIDPNLGY